MYTMQEIFTVLEQYGTTAPAEHTPEIFKTAIAYDSESTTITADEVLRVKKDGTKVMHKVVKQCFCYAYQVAINDTGGDIFRDPSEVVEFLHRAVAAVNNYNKIHDTKAVLIIGVANLAHEWAFIKKYLYENFEITKIFAKSKRDILYIQLDGAIEFRELIGLLGHSLDDIAKNWCDKDNQKLTEFDYSKIRTSITPLSDDERRYMIHDVTTIVQAVRRAIAHYTQPNGVCVLPYTSSGFVRLKLKNAIRDDECLTEERVNFNEWYGRKIGSNLAYLKYKNRKCVTDYFQWYVCREFGYAGGLCGSNIDYAGKLLHNVKCADLTSDYPAQLTHKKYPSGALRRERGDLTRRRKELVAAGKPYFCVIKIAKMHAKTPHAVLSYNKVINGSQGDMTVYPSETPPRHCIVYNGKIYHAENVIVCLNDVDIRAYSELYNWSFGVIALWSFDKYAPAPEWLLTSLWDDYETKSILKIAGKSKTQEYVDAKVRCNSYYGVLAQKIADVYDDVDTELNVMSTKTKTFDDIKNNFWLNPYIAFYCTSYARAALMHFLARYPDEIIQYDTDSLYYMTGGELESALLQYNAEIVRKNQLIFRDRSDPKIFESLGTWDFDETYKRFLGMGAKKYLKEDADGIHTVIAGLPKGAIPKEIESAGIKAPFTYYNPLVKYTRTMNNQIIIKHAFSGKFASVYDDTLHPRVEQMTDYLGNTTLQTIGSYHAIIPIDFTLSMAYEYIKHIIKRRD